VDVYIKMNRQQGYNKMLTGLVSRMTWMGEEEVWAMNTPVSVGDSLLSEQLADEGIKDNEE
jgi:hypothetical protein